MTDDLTYYLYARPVHGGIWCPTCAKPSGVLTSADMLGDDGVLPDAIRYAQCDDCGERLTVPSTGSVGGWPTHD